MEIRGSSGAVWVEALDPDPDDGTDPGEVLLRVDVSSCGFTGCMFPCIRASALREFAAALDGLRGRKTGEATPPRVDGRLRSPSGLGGAGSRAAPGGDRTHHLLRGCEYRRWPA